MGCRWVCLAGFLRLNLTRASTRGRHFDNTRNLHNNVQFSSSDNEACTSLFTLGVLALTTDFIYEDKELILCSRYLSGFYPFSGTQRITSTFLKKVVFIQTPLICYTLLIDESVFQQEISNFAF